MFRHRQVVYDYEYIVSRASKINMFNNSGRRLVHLEGVMKRNVTS